jgi:nucleoside-diphosphate-sugar epimerase
LEKIFITGVSGYIGQKLLAYLSGKQGVQQIVGIDIREPSARPGNFVF